MKDLIIFAVIPILCFTTGFCIGKILCEKEAINSKIFITDPPNNRVIFGDIDEYKSFGSHYIDCKNGMHVSITDNEDCK